MNCSANGTGDGITGEFSRSIVLDKQAIVSMNLSVSGRATSGDWGSTFSGLQINNQFCGESRNDTTPAVVDKIHFTSASCTRFLVPGAYTFSLCPTWNSMTNLNAVGNISVLQ
jgi:hypothetical protein